MQLHMKHVTGKISSKAAFFHSAHSANIALKSF